MSLYKCSQCGATDDSLYTNYRHYLSMHESPLCSECDPAIPTSPAWVAADDG